MSDSGPRIYLHIGRNKAGSTSLQDFFLARHEELASAGLRYCLFGHLKDSVPGVLGFATQFELAEHARSGAHGAYLISNEFMFGWPREFTDSVAAGLAGFDVRVIAYLRPYGDWVHSTYVDAVKGGRTRQDFDAYLDNFRSHISAWPYLEGWGQALGWDRLRIRSLHPRDLVGGNLIDDCMSALGFDRTLVSGAARANQSPHWTVVEMLRALVETDNEAGWSAAALRIVEPLRGLMEDCLTRHPVPATDYLTTTQARGLADLYNCDIARLAERIGTVLQPEVPSERERAMLPRFDCIPAPLLRDWAERATAPAFGAAYPDAAEAAARLSAGR
jgi:hypothetical protein